MVRLRNLAVRLHRDLRGGVTAVGALSLSAVVGMTGIAMELGQGYAQKVQNQRVADAAALAAAIAYSAASDATLVLPTARAVGLANGVPNTGVVAPAPTTDGNRKIITVTVTTAVPLYLTRILTTSASYNVAATGVAAVTTTTTSTGTTPISPNACLIALSASAVPSLLLDGNAKITSDTSNTGCDVQAVKTLRIQGSSGIVARYVQANGDIVIDPNGAGTINAQEVDAAGSITTYSWGTPITTTPKSNNKFSGKSSTIADPLADNAALTAALAKTTTAANFPVVAPPTAPSTPPGDDWTLNNVSGSGVGVQANWRNGSTWTIPAGVARKIGKLTIGGSTTVKFAAGSTVTVSNGIAMGGDRMIIQGTGNSWTVNGDVDSGWGGIEFGSGSYRFGGNVSVSNSLFGDGDFIVTGKLTIGQNSKDRPWPAPPMIFGAGKHQFGELVVDGGAGGSFGDGDFSVARSITVGGAGGLAVNLGSSARSIAIGRTDAATPSLNVTGSGTALFSGTAIATTFTTAGSITTGGDSSIAFPAAANHYIGGTMAIGGAATFGKGAYTVRGDFLKTSSRAVTGSDISVFLSGRMEMSGASTGTLAAPTATGAGAGEALVNILFASTYNVASAGAVKWDGSTNSTYSGVIYFPRMPATVSGAGEVGGCLTLIADTISVLGSGAIKIKRCSNISASAGGATAPPTTTTTTTVALVR